MITKTYIIQNLRELNAAYNKSNGKQSLYLSKLAILELCGWIELSMDDLVERHATRHLCESRNVKYHADEIVKKNYGFDYRSNFRHMMMRTVGLVTLERIERSIGQSIIAPFSSQLGNLKVARDKLAHTYLKGAGAAVSIDAPSVTQNRFSDLYAGLKAYENQLRAL